MAASKSDIVSRILRTAACTAAAMTILVSSIAAAPAYADAPGLPGESSAIKIGGYDAGSGDCAIILAVA